VGDTGGRVAIQPPCNLFSAAASVGCLLSQLRAWTLPTRPPRITTEKRRFS